MITVDQVMAAPGGPPCSAWTRERVAQALEKLDCSSWTAAAESARAGGWTVVSLADLRLTAYRVATPAQRIAGVRRSIQVRIEIDQARWPGADDHTLGVRGELLRWCAGDDGVDLEAICAAAYAAAAYAAYAAAASAADATTYATGADAAAYAAYAAAASAADATGATGADAATYATGAATGAAAHADAAESWNGLAYICGILDGTVEP